MDKDMFYHIHKINSGYEDKWLVGSVINIGTNFNPFYEKCIEFESKIEYNQQNGVPWKKAFDIARQNNMLNPSTDLHLLNTANQIIYEYQLLIREIAFEKVRKEKYNYLPSRTNCIWLCREKQLQFWINQLESNYRIFVVKVFGNVFKSNNNMLSLPNDAYSRIIEKAQKYWSYNNTDEKEDDEYLYIGKIKIIGEIIRDVNQ